MTEREELFHIATHSNNPAWRWLPNNAEMLRFVDYLLANGVTVQKWIPVTEQGEKPMTNGEYIRSMTDEEMALYFACYDTEHNRLRLESVGIAQTAVQLKAMETTLYHSWLRWFKQPVEEV